MLLWNPQINNQSKQLLTTWKCKEPRDYQPWYWPFLPEYSGFSTRGFKTWPFFKKRLYYSFAMQWRLIYGLTDSGRVTHIYVIELGHHWFMQWLVAYSAPSHYLNQLEIVDQWSTRIPPPHRREKVAMGNGWIAIEHCSKSQGSHFERDIADNH